MNCNFKGHEKLANISKIPQHPPILSALPLDRSPVAGVPDVGEGGGAVVGVVAERVEVVGLQPDLALLVQGQDLAGQVLALAAAGGGAVLAALVVRVAAFDL